MKTMTRVLISGLALTVLTASAWAEPVVIDFDMAMKSLNFDPATADGNKNMEGAGNGLLDSAEMALIAAVLADETIDFKASGGASHGDTRAAWVQALASAKADLSLLNKLYPQAPEVVAGYVTIGTDGSFEAINAMCAAFASPLKSDYTLARKLGSVFGPDGDADGDGVSNKEEYKHAFKGKSTDYVAAALNPTVTGTAATSSTVFWCPMRGNPCAVKDYTGAGACDDCGMALIPKSTYEAQEADRKKSAKTVGVLLYPGFEVLDVYGPLEIWAYVKEFDVVTVAAEVGPVRSAQGVETVAQYSFEDCPPLHMVMVPGGLGSLVEVKNEALLDFVRRAHAGSELTTSVCTGSSVLAAAGVLDGVRATSNKRFFDRAAAQREKVTWIREARWVEDGKVITSSGVSAGMDMALHVVRRLYGEPRARQIAFGIEYVWNENADSDPFALGSGSEHP